MTAKLADAAEVRELLVGRARDLQATLRERSVDAETNRCLPVDVVQDLTAAGFFRLLRPSRFGGFQADLHTVVAVVEALGEADASVAWLVAIGAAHDWALGHFPEKTQAEVFGSDSDVLFAGGIQPAQGTRVAGGVRLDGRWPYASGSAHATWATLSAVTTGDDGRPDTLLCMVPADELRLSDTWHTAGMRATGSNTWVARDAFVPEHRTVRLIPLVEGNTEGDGSLYGLPAQPLQPLMLCSPLLGVGRAALDTTISATQAKGGVRHALQHHTGSVGVQIQIAQAALKLQTARLHLYQIVDTLDKAVLQRTNVDPAASVQAAAQCGYAAQQILAAIQELLNVHGAGSFALSSRLQQLWRDANTAARHAMLNSFVGYEMFGKQLLGIDE